MANSQLGLYSFNEFIIVGNIYCWHAQINLDRSSFEFFHFLSSYYKVELNFFAYSSDSYKNLHFTSLFFHS